MIESKRRDPVPCDCDKCNQRTKTGCRVGRKVPQTTCAYYVPKRKQKKTGGRDA